ncbi:MAG: amidohydrolase [Clostridiales bacterium]|nr:amidohydrolase [Candidatus Crickella caballi]
MKADKIYLGNVITMEEDFPVAEAVAVAEGEIVFVGSAADAEAYKDETTELIDYGNNTIYPGFIEAHCHPLVAGTRMMQVDLSKGECLQDYVDTLKKWVADHPGRANYQGAGWKIVDFRPHKSILDEICPDVPMILNSFDGHSVWLNSAALDKFGFDENKVKEFGTELIRVDENGDITGYVSEKPALDLISGMIKLLTPELVSESLLAWQDFAFSQGITACQDAGLTVGGIKVMAAMAEKKLLKIRTAVNLLVDEGKDTDMQAIVDNAYALSQEFDNEYSKVKGIKIFVDGVVEAHTAWLIDEYSDEPGYYGIKRFSDPDNIKNLVKAAAEKNLFIHTHCIGDAATKYVVDGIEAARSEDGRYDQRNEIAHLQIVRPEDIKRTGALNITAVVAPLWVPKTLAPNVDKIELESLGPDRWENEYPIKAFMDEGAMIAFHSDYPVSPAMSVPRSVYMAVTRSNPDIPGSEPRKASERISRMDALKAMTVNPAIQFGEFDNMGSLKVGKIANLVVYDCDFTKDELDTVAKAKLQATIVDGNVVYSA